ncbi:MAG: caspase family protein, partial [Myxococcales bacterium]|nr:caspase family protein [Myxococcales bacterium]
MRWLLLLALALPPWAAAAAPTRRVAVLVAHPTGGPDTEPLQYPTRDAEKLGAVLTELGGFAAEDVAVLTAPTGPQVAAALAQAEARVGQAKAAGERALLLFYYSGHAASGDLQLGAQRLPMATLQQALRGSAADVKLAFLDACQSGAMTRLKGGVRAPGFVVEAEPDAQAAGMVVITSSSAHEASQESDELRGSFFTHHLVSGLRGAADRSGDGVVNLEEAYTYAYHRTVSQTAGTRGGTQHPTFTYDLRGNGQVGLTRLGGRGALLFAGDAAGRYLVYDRDRDLVVGEVDARRGHPTRLSVAPGRYVIKKRTADHLLLQDVAVAAAQQRAVGEGDFQAVAFDEDVTKGPLWLGERVRRRKAWQVGARVGYQAFFDAPSRDDLFHPSALVGVQVEGQNLVARGLSLHLDAAFGGTRTAVAAGPYAEAVPVDFSVFLASVGLSFDGWIGQATRLRAGPHITGVYLRRDFRDGQAPFQDLFTLSPGAAVGLDWRWGALAVGLTVRAHYLRYATE